MDGISGFAGRVITPRHDEYEQARRIWNGAIDRKPAMIARCSGTADVVAALRHARDRGLEVAVRGGGHGVGGAAVCDDGLVVDLSDLRGVEVDPAERRVTAQGGALWGDVDDDTQRYGLATTGGIVTHTGIAGLTLGGGIGWLMREHGMTVDNLTSAVVVTAEGAVAVAGECEEPELFWALRGGGGNFGVVTSFTYRLHEVGPVVLCGPVFWALEDAPEVLRAYRDFAAAAPDELTTIVKLGPAPALPIVPPELRGRLVCSISSCWSGDLSAGELALAPLRGIGTPVLDLLRPRPYGELQRLQDPTVPHGWHYYWKSGEVPALPDGLIDTLVEHTARIASPRSYTLLFQLGGAVSRVPANATAYAHRSAGFAININGVWLPQEPIADAETAWVRQLYAAVEPYQSGVYVNFLGDEGQDRVRAAYGEATYARLAEVKRRFDPDNIFHRNQNILPA
jgi:FAD/FMN-containing dehydrogenase